MPSATPAGVATAAADPAVAPDPEPWMFEVPMPSMRPALRSLRRSASRLDAISIPRRAPAVLPPAPASPAPALAQPAPAPAASAHHALAHPAPAGSARRPARRGAHGPAQHAAAACGSAARATAALCPLVLLLAGCGLSDDPNRFPPACPATAILPDAADLTRTDGRGHDITNTVVDARITALQGSCRDSDDRKSLDASVRVDMDVSRGPAAAGRTEQVPYFVAVSRDGRVLDKRVMTLDVAFPPNTERVHIEGEAISLAFPTPKGVTGASYQIVVGFQLTPDQLAANRARGLR